MGLSVLLTGSHPLTDEETPDVVDVPNEFADYAFDILNALSLRKTHHEIVPNTLPHDELRFILEFTGEVETGQVANDLRKKIQLQPFKLEPLFRSAIVNSSQFYVLRFEKSPSYLTSAEVFDIAHALRNEFQLLSCEPDQVLFSMDRPRASVDPNLDTTPSDKRWCVKSIRANKAQNFAISKGLGVRIALPGGNGHSFANVDSDAVDVVPVDHAISKSVREQSGFVDSQTKTLDTLAMAVVAVNRQGGDVVGAAPNAKIVSIQSASSDLKHNGAALARSIEHALAAGCDIIALGQTGVYCRAVEHAIATAVANNIIVLAAAGDTAGSVCYPARYPNVIAVGGSTSEDLAWECSGSGPAVSFVSPAECVWVSGFSTNSGPDVQNGTALAAALVAGGAALWVAHHGLDLLSNHAEKRNCSMQELFRRAVRHTARQPNNWDRERHGAGIIDCEALVKLSMDHIPETSGPPLRMFPGHIGEIASFVQECIGQLPNGNKFDLMSFGAEITNLANVCFGAESAESPTNDDSDEIRPSKYLQNAIINSGDEALMRFLNQS